MIIGWRRCRALGPVCEGGPMANHRPEPATLAEDVLEEIKQQLANLQFGSLEIQVHNGQVVQLERREKKRLDRSVNAK